MTLPADTHEIACSLLRPPNTTATRTLPPPLLAVPLIAGNPSRARARAPGAPRVRRWSRRGSPGLVLTDHELVVPLDHTDPGGRSITVYAREVVAPSREHDDLPWLLFLQ